MGGPGLIFIKDVIRSLKKEYGTEILLRKRDPVFDIETGEPTNTATECTVNRGIVLPSKILNRIGIGSRQSLNAPVNDIDYTSVLLDANDLTLTPDIHTQVIINEITYRAIEVYKIIEYNCYALKISSIEGTTE